MLRDSKKLGFGAYLPHRTTLTTADGLVTALTAAGLTLVERRTPRDIFADAGAGLGGGARHR